MTSVEQMRREHFWNHLTRTISKGTVVPVVGEELLQISDGPPPELLYPGLAERLAAFLELELPDNRRGNLNATVRSHPKFTTNPYAVARDLEVVMTAWNPPIPDVLRSLAGIRHFNLFISTTCDDMLERAINEVRFGGERLTEVIAFSPKNVPTEQQLSRQLTSGRPVVFQLFGNSREPTEYALTEEDRVEYVHALQGSGYRPRRLFSELYDRPLLLLGNSFPDWLTRLFLRMVRRVPLDNKESPAQFLAEKNGVTDSLKFFLVNFATNTELVEESDPVRFVRELAQRWNNEFGARNEQTTPSTSRSSPKPMPKNAVFVSYCRSALSGAPSDDVKTAIAIRDALEARGVEVWLDQDQLQPGDECERKIERYISTCSLFIPLISPTTESREDAFFRREWSLAVRRLPDFTGSDRQFVLPVVIGRVNPYEAHVPEEFKRFQFTPIHEARPEAHFVDHVQWLYERARAGGRQ